LVALLDVIAISRTASRAAAVATVLVLLITVANRTALKPRNLALIGASSVLAVIGVLRFVNLSALQRLNSTVGEVQQGTLNDRTFYWGLAWKYWSAAPLQGVGGGAFKVRSAVDGGGKVAHSVFFGTTAELGIIGLLILLLLLVLAGRRVYQSPRRQLSRYVLAAYAAWLCGALTLTLEIRKITWLLLAIATCEGFRLVRHSSDGSAR
jgi:O-antigen ligase